jgi:hypothetical protein
MSELRKSGSVCICIWLIIIFLTVLINCVMFMTSSVSHGVVLCPL